MNIDNETTEFTSLTQAYHYLTLARYNTENRDAIRDAALDYVYGETQRSLSLSNEDKIKLRNMFFVLATEGDE